MPKCCTTTKGGALSRTAYDKRIRIEQLTGTPDAHGFVDQEDDNNWSAYAVAYAAVQSKGGREFWKVDQMTADVTHEWTCQWSATLAAATPDMRLRSEGTTHELVSVIDVDLAHQRIKIQTKVAV